MSDIVVRVYDCAGNRELIALVPLAIGEDTPPDEIVASAKNLLKSIGRFSNKEVESFRYQFDQPGDRLREGAPPAAINDRHREL